MPREEEIKGLIKDLSHKKPLRRVDAMNRLVEIGEPAIPHLIKALRNENEPARRVAAWALGEIGDVDAVPHLIKALKGKNWNVRQDAAVALGKIGHLDAVRPLIKTLEDKNEYVREDAAWALGKIGKKLKEVPPKKNEPEEMRALRLVGKHFVENEKPKVVINAFEAALKKEIDENNVKLYIKQLRALKGNLK